MSIYVENLHYPSLQTLSISGHFRRFHFKHFLSHPTKVANTF